LLLLAQFRDAAAELVQAEQLFLIRRDQALHPVGQPGLLSLQTVHSLSKGIHVSGGFQPAVQFGLNQTGIFQQPQDLRPDGGIEIVLTNRATVTESPLQMPVGIRTQAPVVVDLVPGGPSGSPIERVAATLADQHALQQGGLKGAPRRMALVLLQLLLGQGKNLFADQSRHGNLNPFLVRPLVVGAIAIGQTLALSQGPGDPLPGTDLGFAEARPPSVSWITQHAPYRGSFPARGSGARRDLALVEHPRDRIDALVLLGIDIEDHLHHLGLRLDHFIVGGRVLALLHVAIAERGAGKHIDRTLLRAMALAASGTLRNLRPLIFRNHALELHQQLVLRSFSRRRFQKDDFHPAAGQLLDQENLIGILATETIGRMDENRFELSPGRQIAQRFQSRAQQRGATIAFILKPPLGRDQVIVDLSVLDQCHHLAGNGMLLLLPIGGNSRVEGGRFLHLKPLEHGQGRQPPAHAVPVPAMHKLAQAFQPVSDRTDIPAEWPSARHPAAFQPRFSSRFRNFKTAWLTRSLKVSPVKDA
jgi:hypothetical protein